MSTHGFIIHVCGEPDRIVRNCLASLDAEYVLIDDSLTKLKRDLSRASWTKRYLTAGIEAGWDVIFKMDPDAVMLRPFQDFPPEPVFGLYRANPKAQVYRVAGFCRGVRREAAEAILASGLLDVPIPANLVGVGNRAGLVWEDALFANICRTLGIAMVNWPAVALCDPESCVALQLPLPRRPVLPLSEPT